MLIKVQNEAPFQVLTGAFTIGPSETGYELQVGATPRNFTTLFSVGANTTRMVTNVANGSYYRLKNNVGEVTVNWSKTCVTEGGSGGSGTELSPVTEFPLEAEAGTVVAYNGTASASGVYQYTGEEWIPVGVDDLSAYWTSAQTQSAITIVEDHLYDVEQVTASALTELHNQIDVMDEVVATSLVDLNDRIVELSGSSVDLSAYYTSAQTEDAISAATSGKADAASVSANTNAYMFPTWNEQGVITGAITNVITREPVKAELAQFNVNGNTLRQLFGTINRRIDIYAPETTGVTGQIPVLTRPYKAEWATPITVNGSAITAGGNVYAPVSAGTAGDILVSTGNGAPVWTTDNKVSSASVSTIWKGTQAEYDAIASKDPATLYIIL